MRHGERAQENGRGREEKGRIAKRAEGREKEKEKRGEKLAE